MLSSYGHVRDLREKDGAVEPDNDFAMHWEIGDRAKKPLGEIQKALKSAKRLFLATDPDREGEAISWHLQQVLNEAKKLKGVEVKRVVFNEITKSAVLEAMKNPRDLDDDLVNAYMARRALDFLVGFTLSPVLWRKLPGSKSAGRVQSVALRLICERETEIERFKAQEYWTVDAEFTTPAGAPFTARLTHLDGTKLDKFSLGTKAAADTAVATINGGDPYKVISVEKKRTKRNPMPPFTTSTLQQEASRKLGFGAGRTMRLAQQLYEGTEIDGETVGLITYMRTDGVTLSQEAIGAARKLIGEQYGPTYVPESPRVWKTKQKNAQEAHEAIRPTDLFRRPDQAAKYLDADQRRLYELIWKRTISSEMESAALDQTAVDIASANGKTVFRATGSVIVFDGFLAVYHEDRDEPIEDDDEGRLLPPLAQGDATKRGDRHAGAAFHPAAAALFGSEPGQEARGARHRPSLDLCQHPRSAAGAHLCEAGEAPLHPGRSRPRGRRRSWRASSIAMSSTISPPISKISSTRSPAAAPIGARCCASSGRISPPRWPRPRT